MPLNYRYDCKILLNCGIGAFTHSPSLQTTTQTANGVSTITAPVTTTIAKASQLTDTLAYSKPVSSHKETQTDINKYVIVWSDESMAKANEVPLTNNYLLMSNLRIAYPRASGIKYRCVFTCTKWAFKCYNAEIPQRVRFVSLRHLTMAKSSRQRKAGTCIEWCCAAVAKRRQKERNRSPLSSLRLHNS